MRLDGKVAFVTGSTRGIGWATARLLAERGATLILNGRSPEQLEARAAELSRETGARVHALAGSVADPATVRGWYQRIFKEHRQLDVLVNNAGILEDALLGMIPDDLIERTLSVNVAGAIHNLQAAARLMTRRKSGSIVNVSSIIGVRGNEGQVVYGASKAAIVGLTLSASKELAGANVRVNAVAPGFIDTDMTRALPKDKFEERLRGVKMRRIGTPRDVANAILFLASDLSEYVTGQVLGVDGGMLV